MKVIEIPRRELIIDKMNVRKEWVSDDGLTDSIEKKGIIEPLVVRKKNGKYGIVCGSRRFNAGLEAGLKEFPCIVKNIDDIDAMALSIQENIQRKSLSIIEEVNAYKNLWDIIDREVAEGKRKTNEEKMDYFFDRFGIRKSLLYQKLAISEQSENFKKQVMDMVPDSGKSVVDYASRVANMDKLSSSAKLKVLKKVQSKEQHETRKKFLQRVKESVKEGKSVDEAIKKADRVPEVMRYTVTFSTTIQNGLERATRKLNMHYADIIEDATEAWLKRKGFLK